MPKRRGGSVVVVFLTAAAAGCAHASAGADFPCLTPGPEWEGSLWQQQVQAYAGGFGGWFRGRIEGHGKPDKMNVYFLDPKRGIRSLHADHPTSIYNIMQGQYTILQLHSCMKALADNPDLARLGAFQVDQPSNRIALMVQDTTSADSIRRVIRRSRVAPGKMVIIRKMKRAFIFRHDEPVPVDPAPPASGRPQGP